MSRGNSNATIPEQDRSQVGRWKHAFRPTTVRDKLVQVGWLCVVPFTWSYGHVRGEVLRVRKKGRLSFITIHYIYLLALTILGSILLYPAGYMAYIDALFFAAGGATQSGLNTINVNSITLYQQIVIYMLGMIANPIFINTVVVFVRLYWFERRFQHIVSEARSLRRSKSKSRQNSQARDLGDDLPESERGVAGRKITVLRDEGKIITPGMGFQYIKTPIPESATASSSETDERTDESSSSATTDTSTTAGEKSSRPTNGDMIVRKDEDENDESDEIDEKNEHESRTEKPQNTQRGIVFADEVHNPLERRVGDDIDYTPERHITFLENQRNPKDKTILRIPGPREIDSGARAEVISDGSSSDDDDPGFVRSSVPRRATDEVRTSTDTTARRQSLRKSHTYAPSTHSKVAATSTNGKESEDKARFRNPFSYSRRDSTSLRTQGRTRSMSLFRSTERTEEPAPYLSWQPTVGRNSMFINLTEEQREELGGIEYRSLKTLAVILVSYFVFFHAMGAIILVPWILSSTTQYWQAVLDSDAVNYVWWGIFSSATFFNDVGFTLTPDSFISFSTAVVPLLVGTFLIIIGNTGFPCMLRFVIWVISNFVPFTSGLWEELRFLLDHPRRCFTLLFPQNATWVLVGILILLNGVDLIFYIILDINDPTVTSVGSAGFEVLDGIFQAASTRTAGTAVVNIADLHPGIQVSYLIMMYISVFPIAISVRRTNVYEESSLGIYHSGENDDDANDPSYIGAHLRRQLSFDLWFIFAGLFIIAIAEGSQIADPNLPAFTLFACLFEIVSAYGTVGLSLGWPTNDASFSAEFSVVSKLVIIAMMIRGRHRGLPYELDRAILLPSEALQEHEQREDERNRNRRPSAMSIAPDAEEPLTQTQSRRQPSNSAAIPAHALSVEEAAKLLAEGRLAEHDREHVDYLHGHKRNDSSTSGTAAARQTSNISTAKSNPDSPPKDSTLNKLTHVASPRRDLGSMLFSLASAGPSRALHTHRRRGSESDAMTSRRRKED